MIDLTPFEIIEERTTIENNTPPLDHSTILYACCTPGLTAFFDDKLSNRNDQQQRPKTIDCDSGEQSGKNATLVRRELRYETIDCDIVTAKKTNSPDQPNQKSIINSVRTKFHRFFHLKNHRRKQIGNIITSTPINFLDCTGPDGDYATPTPNNIRKWKESMRHENERSLPLESFRYQCGHCKRVWYNNWELMDHMQENHLGYRFWFRRGYRCGICPSRFFINQFLIWHSNRYHNNTR